MVKESNFIRFWRALNGELRSVGHPEANFGQARFVYIVMLMECL